jgi:Septum formation
MGSRGARWAAAGTVVGVAAMVAVASLWMIRNAPDSTADSADQVPGVVPIASLPFAACYAIPRDARGDIMTANGVYPVDCDAEHDGQILEQVSLENLAWAGSVAMKASAQNQCSAAFNRYRATFMEPETLIPGYFLPDEPQWNKGNRTITCTLTMEAPFSGPKL